MSQCMTRNNQQQQQQQQQQQHQHQHQQEQKQFPSKMFSSDAELLCQAAKTEQTRVKSPREKRVGLIAAMGHFRPKNATPIQFYNYVREFCIIHNCSIDEAMERAPNAWTGLSKDQRKLYDSEMHAALPIPVPRHLIYRAFQMERAGRWKISSSPANNGASSYSVESYVPPVKPTKMEERLRAQQPRYDNLADPTWPKKTITSPKKTVRTLTPPEQRAQRAQMEKCPLSITQILSAQSLKGLRSGRLKSLNKQQQPIKCKSKKQLSSAGRTKQSSEQQQQQQHQHQHQQKLQQQQQQPAKEQQPQTALKRKCPQGHKRSKKRSK